MPVRSENVWWCYSYRGIHSGCFVLDKNFSYGFLATLGKIWDRKFLYLSEVKMCGGAIYVLGIHRGCFVFIKIASVNF